MGKLHLAEEPGTGATPVGEEQRAAPLCTGSDLLVPGESFLGCALIPEGRPGACRPPVLGAGEAHCGNSPVSPVVCQDRSAEHSELPSVTGICLTAQYRSHLLSSKSTFMNPTGQQRSRSQPKSTLGSTSSFISHGFSLRTC